ncbi:RET [Cordylochernes scorpioides]|uniref:RET n=1 Tax=Cordylochernes scorpioides TaxID=51811 RepID=A0ABY6K0K6_9ARAC|nr:RET [Cordylochernes scorpioides]
MSRSEQLAHDSFCCHSWAFGILFWEIMTLGATPYPSVPPEKLYNFLEEGNRNDRPQSCSQEIYNLMQECWKFNPADRPTFTSLVQFLGDLLSQVSDQAMIIMVSDIRMSSCSFLCQSVGLLISRDSHKMLVLIQSENGIDSAMIIMQFDFALTNVPEPRLEYLELSIPILDTPPSSSEFCASKLIRK